ncbi:MAG: uroporphyrinogen-III synthase [Gemmataceae bacterium]|nr:uroporphyrinogen-III synthase [Gemmataceae bacterium]
MSLAGRVVALAEGRQLEELAQLLAKEQAVVLRCPMIGIRDNPDEGHVVSWLHDLISGQFSLVILLTGEGLRRLTGFAARRGIQDRMVHALGQTRLLVRGPKPIQALRELGLKPTWTAAKPTTEGVLDVLRTIPLEGVTVGVQLYDQANDTLERFLTQSGARPACVLPYVYAPAAETEQVAQLLQRINEGTVDAIVFTSAPQVERLYAVMAERHLAVDWSKTRVAAVGPVVAEALRRHDAPVHVCPEQGFQMKNLVHHLRNSFRVS